MTTQSAEMRNNSFRFRHRANCHMFTFAGPMGCRHLYRSWIRKYGMTHISNSHTHEANKIESQSNSNSVRTLGSCFANRVGDTILTFPPFEQWLLTFRYLGTYESVSNFIQLFRNEIQFLSKKNWIVLLPPAVCISATLNWQMGIEHNVFYSNSLRHTSCGNASALLIWHNVELTLPICVRWQ